MKIEVLEVARQEFDEAFEYYEARQRGLGEEKFERVSPLAFRFGSRRF